MLVNCAFIYFYQDLNISENNSRLSCVGLPCVQNLLDFYNIKIHTCIYKQKKAPKLEIFQIPKIWSSFACTRLSYGTIRNSIHWTNIVAIFHSLIKEDIYDAKILILAWTHNNSKRHEYQQACMFTQVESKSFSLLSVIDWAKKIHGRGICNKILRYMLCVLRNPRELAKFSRYEYCKTRQSHDLRILAYVTRGRGKNK
jgi:hypothetical protein